MYLSLFDLEIYVVKCFNAGEGLCYVLHFQQNICHVLSSVSTGCQKKHTGGQIPACMKCRQNLFKLICCVVSGSNKDFLVVVYICEYRIAKVRRNNLGTVVICLCIVNVNCLALNNLCNHLDNLACKCTCILKY